MYRTGTLCGIRHIFRHKHIYTQTFVRSLSLSPSGRRYSTRRKRESKEHSASIQYSYSFSIFDQMCNPGGNRRATERMVSFWKRIDCTLCQCLLTTPPSTLCVYVWVCSARAEYRTYSPIEDWNSTRATPCFSSLCFYIRLFRTSNVFLLQRGTKCWIQQLQRLSGSRDWTMCGAYVLNATSNGIPLFACRIESTAQTNGQTNEWTCRYNHFVGNNLFATRSSCWSTQFYWFFIQKKNKIKLNLSRFCLGIFCESVYWSTSDTLQKVSSRNFNQQLNNTFSAVIQVHNAMSWFLLLNWCLRRFSNSFRLFRCFVCENRRAKCNVSINSLFNFMGTCVNECVTFNVHTTCRYKVWFNRINALLLGYRTIYSRNLFCATAA